MGFSTGKIELDCGFVSDRIRRITVILVIIFIQKGNITYACVTLNLPRQVNVLFDVKYYRQYAAYTDLIKPQL